MPAYVCHGAADGTIPVTQARELAGRLKGSPSFTYAELPGGGHDTPLPRFEAGLAWVLQKMGAR